MTLNRLGSSGGLLLVAMTVAAAPPPKDYLTQQPGSQDIHAPYVKDVGPPPSRGVTVTAFGNGVEAYRPDTALGFEFAQAIPRQGCYAHVPVFLTGTPWEDLILIGSDGTNVNFEQWGPEGDPTSTPYLFDRRVSLGSAYAPPANVSHMALAGEIDGTGDLDIVAIVATDGVAVAQTDPVTHKLTGTPTLVSLGFPVDSIALGDLDGDGKAELLVRDRAAGFVRGFANVTTSPSVIGFTYQFGVNFGADIGDVLFIDLNNDGKLDLVVSRSNMDDIAVALNTGGSPPYSGYTTYPTDPNPTALASGDIDPGDGDTDIWVTCLPGLGYGVLDEFANDGAGALTLSGQYYMAPPANPNSVVIVNTDFGGTADPSGFYTIFKTGQNGNMSSADAFLVGPGPGLANPATVHVHAGGGYPISTIDFNAYGGGYGVKVAGGDIDGATVLHATDEVITGPGPGAVYGPQVRAFRRCLLQLCSIGKVNFYAYGTLKYGVNIASCDLDGDGIDEILTGAGPGAVFGPHVRAFNFDNVALQAIQKISFFAYGTLKYGVNVGCGDVDGDSYGEILTAPGPSAAFGPTIRGFNFDGTSVTSIAKINFNAFTLPQYGARVAAGDIEKDSYDEIGAAPGPGPTNPARVMGFNYDNATITPITGFDITPWSTYYGANIAFGDVNGDDKADLIVGTGSDAAAPGTVTAYAWSGSALTQWVTFQPFPTLFYGVNVGAALLAY